MVKSEPWEGVKLGNESQIDVLIQTGWDFFYPLKVNHSYLSEIIFEAERDWKGMGYAWDYYLGAVKGACSREYWLAMAGERSFTPFDNLLCR